MAFNFGNVGNNNVGGLGGVSQGPKLENIYTETLGFLSLSGDAKLQLTSQWSRPPVESASLISIASRQGLVAAAGPDAVVLSSTDAVRRAFDSPKASDSEIRAFEPPLKLPLPIRICQLAFTADEAFLILSAEQGGGLAVYQVEALQKGATQSAFEIPTNGESLRALVPNPRPEKGELCAVVTTEGKLLMANMKERNFISGPSGQILRDQVSCVAWSNKGKQLVAGLGDGTILQMTPEGNVKAEIPRPPDLNPAYYVSSLVWLENDVFLVFHVSTSEKPPQTRCHLITRQGPNFQFQQLNDPVEPYDNNATPHHTVARLKDFPPNLQDLLICSSTATADIGLFTRSKTPLAPNGPSNVLITTELADDSKRAILPMNNSMESPAPIGIALDLSSREKVYKPIPTDDLDQSSGPLPGYWVLNADGVLSVWWVIYSESIRAGTTYPGLAAAENNVARTAEIATPKHASSKPFGTSSSTFGVPSGVTGASFGSPSMVGSKSSPWVPQPSGGPSGPAFGSSSFGTTAASSAPKFGTPSFGTPSLGTIGTPAFGQSTGLGARSSPWASGSVSSGTPAFGHTGFASNTKNTSGSDGSFGVPSRSSTNANSGFASFASEGGGFASLKPDNPVAMFSSPKSQAPEVSMDADNTSIFRAPISKPSTGGAGIFGSQPFKLTSSFLRDPNAVDGDDDDASAAKASNAGQSMFGANFTATINESTGPVGSGPFATKTQSTFGQLAPSTGAESTTPTSTPAPSKSFSQTSSTPLGKGLFDFRPKTPSGLNSLLGPSNSQTPPAKTPPVKIEAETPKALEVFAEAPLPPESTSKATYPLGDSSSSSAATVDTSEMKGAFSGAEEAPLPPDFNDSTPKAGGSETPRRDLPPAVDDAPLPPDPVKNKKVYEVPLPPLPGAKPKPGEETPLPPDPVKQPMASDAKLPAVPIAKPASQAAGPGFKFPTNLPPIPSDSEDDDLSEEDVGTEAASEGSGVDVAKDLSPSSTSANKTPGFTPQSSFDGLAGSYSTISRPDQERRSFFGDLGRNVPVFPQPNPVSPRSPSPVRGSVPARVLGKDQPRSFSAPGMASHILGASRRQQSRLGSSIVGKDTYVEDAIIEQQRKVKARKEAEENRLLLDEEDDTVQDILRTEVKPTRELDEFIAHSGVAPPAGDSVPAQVEAVYRDINSMIDTLGLNARSLAGFIKGHTELSTEQHTRQDLVAPDGWALVGLESIARIMDEDLSAALDKARVTGGAGKLAECEDIQRELVRDRNKQADLRKIVTSRLDPGQTVANRALPLSAEQAAQQSDLRREYARFRKILAEAEEHLALLKAKIVSASGATGKGGPTPTIEAVVRTITKLTSMVEKRSGDIDVLENQMRKLRVGSYGPSSREGSPSTTPNGKRLPVSSVFSPDRSVRGSTPHRSSALRHSLSGSVASISGGMFHTPPRKKLSGFGDTEKKAVREKRQRRSAVLGKLKGSLQKKGVGVWAVEDIE